MKFMSLHYFRVNQNPKDFKEELKAFGFHDKIGVYKLYYFKNSSPRSINRLIGKDTKGILYIGMTEVPFLTRVCNLQHALFGNSHKEAGNDGPSNSGHTQMGKKYYRIRHKVKIEDLFIGIFPNETPKNAESNALEKYVKEFGELPPLNGQYGSFDPDWKMFSK